MFIARVECFGGGMRGPRVLGVGVNGVPGGEVTGRLEVEDVGEDVTEEEGVPVTLRVVGDVGVGTTSG